jgi:hypothetical protein
MIRTKVSTVLLLLTAMHAVIPEVDEITIRQHKTGEANVVGVSDYVRKVLSRWITESKKLPARFLHNRDLGHTSIATHGPIVACETPGDLGSAARWGVTMIKTLIRTGLTCATLEVSLSAANAQDLYPDDVMIGRGIQMCLNEGRSPNFCHCYVPYFYNLWNGAGRRPDYAPQAQSEAMRACSGG